MLKKIKWLASFYRDFSGVVAILLILTPLQAAFEVTVPRLIGFTSSSNASGHGSRNPGSPC